MALLKPDLAGYRCAIMWHKGINMAQSVNLYEVEGQLTVLGARISTARLRRRWSTEELATRAGVEIRTISRLEEGDSGVGLGLFLTVIWILGLWDTISGVASPDLDEVGQFLERERQPVAAEDV